MGFLSHFFSHLPHFYDVIWLIFETLCSATSYLPVNLKTNPNLSSLCLNKSRDHEHGRARWGDHEHRRAELLIMSLGVRGGGDHEYRRAELVIMSIDVQSW